MTVGNLGNLIDALGVEQTIKEGELVAGAVVLLKVVTADGEVLLRSAWSDGISWVERVGMLRAAERTELPPDGGSRLALPD